MLCLSAGFMKKFFVHSFVLLSLGAASIQTSQAKKASVTDCQDELVALSGAFEVSLYREALHFWSNQKISNLSWEEFVEKFGGEINTPYRFIALIDSVSARALGHRGIDIFSLYQWSTDLGDRWTVGRPKVFKAQSDRVKIKGKKWKWLKAIFAQTSDFKIIFQSPQKAYSDPTVLMDAIVNVLVSLEFISQMRIETDAPGGLLPIGRGSQNYSRWISDRFATSSMYAYSPLFALETFFETDFVSRVLPMRDGYRRIPLVSPFKSFFSWGASFVFPFLYSAAGRYELNQADYNFWKEHFVYEGGRQYFQRFRSRFQHRFTGAWIQRQYWRFVLASSLYYFSVSTPALAVYLVSQDWSFIREQAEMVDPEFIKRAFEESVNRQGDPLVIAGFATDLMAIDQEIQKLESLGGVSVDEVQKQNSLAELYKHRSFIERRLQEELQKMNPETDTEGSSEESQP